MVTLNVETDATVGLELNRTARAAGAVYTVAAGDEPVCALELVDFSLDLGFEVVCAGKGKNNPLRVDTTPASVAAEARAKAMNPKMLASFVDGSKTMIEIAALANATGLLPDVVGTHGPRGGRRRACGRVPSRGRWWSAVGPGRVDYAFGPAPGAFVVITTIDKTVAEEMGYLQMGKGPYWCLYRPYHLASLEAPRSIARAVLGGQADLAAACWVAEVVAITKRDLKPGDMLDGIGRDSVRGLIHAATEAADLLPLGPPTGRWHRPGRSRRAGPTRPRRGASLGDRLIAGAAA